MIGRLILVGAGCALSLLSFLDGAQAGKFKVLYSFSGANDGKTPYAPLYRDGSGNLFGTTAYGGADGKGSAFEIKANGKESVIHNFGSGGDGLYPLAGLISDKSGNLYGTTQAGGTHNDGIVFRLSRNGTETILYNFSGYPGDGAYPDAALIRDKAGNLYGITSQGGSDPDCGNGCGTVFEITPQGSETILHSFSYGSGDGSSPAAALMMDKSGNLFGTTAAGGGGTACNFGCGTVFEVTPQKTETVLYYFKGGSDGSAPWSPLIVDRKGNLYGTTNAGGGSGCSGSGCGTVFKLEPNGDEAPLYSFTGGKDGGQPYYSGLIADAGGNLYGTTLAGGAAASGTLFEVTPRGREKVLYSLNGGNDGLNPAAGLIADAAGNLYGTAMAGGAGGQGTVFTLKE